MIRRNALIGAVVTALTTPVWAGVETLTSDEMVETYVEDSTLIVVPKDQRKTREERKRVLQSLTISPGEPVVSESEEQAYSFLLRESERTGQDDALTNAQDQFVRNALLFPTDQVRQAQPVANLTPRTIPVIFGQQPEIPEAPFVQNFLGNQLGIGFDGQNVNFSIGNPPGIDQIQVPKAINEGPVQLTPRAGGGFDLSIAVPDR
ncbi:hypothetical protein CF392_15145 [Tamilnaduibacter salinus]|uniref:Uncharacterized protein n=1 Tax=Tamilnaduibacter salinus TaxID=1484056 RepID=A0A2A2HZZ2_9GAMM|nr:hypothetical protein [Tamilnaduibacter salinus]PAV24626.1 hypothetical protein CF392_15145 [Tamilnaduibacter salinus]